MHTLHSQLYHPGQLLRGETHLDGGPWRQAENLWGHGCHLAGPGARWVRTKYVVCFLLFAGGGYRNIVNCLLQLMIFCDGNMSECYVVGTLNLTIWSDSLFFHASH